MVISDNLLGVSQSFFSPEIVQKISGFIGLSEDKTKIGLKSVIPALTTGIVDKGSTTEGAATLVDMVKSHNFEASTKPDESKLNEGNDVVKNIFGSKLNSVVENLGSSTGLSGASISKMLGLAAPVLMGVLGSKVKNENLGTSGLMNFLSQQKKSLSALSAGAMGAVGAAGAAGKSGFSTITGMAGEKREAFQKQVSAGRPWGKIALGVLVLLGLLFWWLNSQQKMTSPIATISAPIKTVTAPVEMALEKIVTPSINELSAFMASGTIADLPKTFRFEKLVFASGTTVLIPGAETELDKIASAMKQYPASSARIDGYTDNVGQEEANQQLSAGRAEVVKAELVARGIDETRIQTVGMGSLNPVADNATEEGRAENRRIEFVVTNIK